MASIRKQRCILIAEDRDAEREALARVLRLEGFAVIAARNPAEAMQHATAGVDLVISDLRMGAQSGVDLLAWWRERWPGTPFLLLTAFGTVDTAVAAMKLGAADFLTKPVDPDQLLSLVNSLLGRGDSASQSAAVGNLLVDERGESRIVGSSQALVAVCEQARRAAQTQSTVLILGESGTGKELFSEAIHANSPRREGPFVTVNMAAIPETLVESELFGHVRGAFTSAVANRTGRFEAAHGGTLFIDEIGDFPLSLQAKLLRALENRTVTPVGGDREVACDVRVVAATSRPLSRMRQLGQFREDLYYRLNVISLQLPPLRERRQDVPLLARHFLAEFASRSGRKPLALSPDLARELERLPWPGNVRQLRNCLEQMHALVKGELLTLADLPADLRQDSGEEEAQVGSADLEAIKRTAILQALRQFDGNRTRAADFLGISVRTLQRKLRDWGMSTSIPGESH
ncbi:MAG: sigma-54 dependent transcriptional regulator [Pirellulaceae bacterium]|nr:sigma-54 dependent transcriptional regulator [Pirellulaceae bacterium]